MITDTVQRLVGLAEDIPEILMLHTGTCWPLAGEVIFTGPYAEAMAGPAQNKLIERKVIIVEQ